MIDGSTALTRGRCPFDLRHRHRRPQRIAPRPLDIHHPGALYRVGEARPVDMAVLRQVEHLKGDAPLLQAAMAFPTQAHHLFQGVIGTAGDGQDPVPGAQHAKQRHGEGMGTGDEVVPDQGVLTAEHLRQDGVQRLPAHIVVAIAGGPGKHRLTHPVLDKGGKHLLGVVVGRLINGGKLPGGLGLGSGDQGLDLRVHREKRLVHLLY